MRHFSVSYRKNIYIQFTKFDSQSIYLFLLNFVSNANFSCTAPHSLIGRADLLRISENKEEDVSDVQIEWTGT